MDTLNEFTSIDQARRAWSDCVSYANKLELEIDRLKIQFAAELNAAKNDYARYKQLKATNAELLEALRLCECELTLYVGLAEQSNNPQAWQDAITAAREAIRKASR